MKTSSNELLFLVESAQEGGFTARAFGESIFTEADTLEELRVMIKDAVECHFEPNATPRLVRLHIVRDEILEIA
jgi:predicted RNase H-like HicB family nuclease